MLKEDIKKDLNEALKSREELKTSVLRLLSSAILNKEKDKRYKSGKAEDVSLTDEEITDVISFESKKRKEAMTTTAVTRKKVCWYLRKNSSIRDFAPRVSLIQKCG